MEIITDTWKVDDWVFGGSLEVRKDSVEVYVMFGSNIYEILIFKQTDVKEGR